MTTVQDAYNIWSETYDSDENLTRDLDARITRQVLAGWHGRALLELGCGTGKNTAFLAEIAPHVYALDFSEGMLAHAQRRITAAHVTLGMADVTQAWPVANQRVDLVVANLILEHVADLGHIFRQANRCLAADGRFFISELHPFKQYLGTKARFEQADGRTEITAYTHHISEFIGSAAVHGLRLEQFNEWWHEQDAHKPPRLVSFLFQKVG